MAIIKNLNEQQLVPFLFFCKGLFEKTSITREDFQDVEIKEDSKGIKVTFTVSSDFIRKNSQESVAFEELKRIEAYSKQHGEVGEAKSM